MERWGKAAVKQLSENVEANVARVAETSTYRFYGSATNGTMNPITTSLQLATAIAEFQSFGSIMTELKMYLSNLTYPQIVNSNLNQFTLDRNNREAMSWEVGEFSGCNFFRSNLLTTHYAGDCGNEGLTLTVVSTTLNPDGSVASITFSGAPASDANAVKAYDKFEFVDGVTGFRNLRYLTFIGGAVSQAPVQFSAQFDAASTAGGDVTVTLGTINGSLPLFAGIPTTTEFGINTAIVPGMQVTVLPDHRCGLLTSGNPLFLAMPKLNDQPPFPTSVAMDEETGVSIRQTFGTVFGQNQQAMIHDCIWGKSLVTENSFLIALPV
jgi:P22 coat protein - gene protein 5